MVTIPMEFRETLVALKVVELNFAVKGERRRKGEKINSSGL